MTKRNARQFLRKMLAKRRLTLVEWAKIGDAVRALGR